MLKELVEITERFGQDASGSSSLSCPHHWASGDGRAGRLTDLAHISNTMYPTFDTNMDWRLRVVFSGLVHCCGDQLGEVVVYFLVVLVLVSCDSRTTWHRFYVLGPPSPKCLGLIFFIGEAVQGVGLGADWFPCLCLIDFGSQWRQHVDSKA